MGARIYSYRHTHIAGMAQSYLNPTQYVRDALAISTLFQHIGEKSNSQYCT